MRVAQSQNSLRHHRFIWSTWLHLCEYLAEVGPHGPHGTSQFANDTPTRESSDRNGLGNIWQRWTAWTAWTSEFANDTPHATGSPDCIGPHRK